MYTCLDVNSEGMKMRRGILFFDDKCTYDELERAFPSELGCSKNNGVVRNIEFIKENPNRQIRFFAGEPIKLIDNTFVVVCSQWGNSGAAKIYFQNLLDHIKTMYHVYTRSKLK